MPVGTARLPAWALSSIRSSMLPRTVGSGVSRPEEINFVDEVAHGELPYKTALSQPMATIQEFMLLIRRSGRASGHGTPSVPKANQLCPVTRHFDDSWGDQAWTPNDTRSHVYIGFGSHGGSHAQTSKALGSSAPSSSSRRPPASSLRDANSSKSIDEVRVGNRNTGHFVEAHEHHSSNKRSCLREGHGLPRGSRSLTGVPGAITADGWQIRRRRKGAVLGRRCPSRMASVRSDHLVCLVQSTPVIGAVLREGPACATSPSARSDHHQVGAEVRLVPAVE